MCGSLSVCVYAMHRHTHILCVCVWLCSSQRKTGIPSERVGAGSGEKSDIKRGQKERVKWGRLFFFGIILPPSVHTRNNTYCQLCQWVWGDFLCHVSHSIHTKRNRHAVHWDNMFNFDLSSQFDIINQIWLSLLTSQEKDLDSELKRGETSQRKNVCCQSNID